MTYVEAGRGTLGMLGGPLEFRPGDLLLFLAGKTYRNLGDQIGLRKVSLYFQWLPGDAVLEDIPEAPAAEKMFLLPEHCSLRAMPGARNLLERLGDVRRDQLADPRRQLRVNLYFEQLLFELGERLMPPREMSDPVTAAAIRIIESNLADPPRICEIAKMVGISRTALTDRFKAATGVPIALYARELRLNAAADILALDGAAPLKQVAAATGFTDEFHLSKSFKRCFGISPRLYRGANSERIRPPLTG